MPQRLPGELDEREQKFLNALERIASAIQFPSPPMPTGAAFNSEALMRQAIDRLDNIEEWMGRISKTLSETHKTYERHTLALERLVFAAREWMRDEEDRRRSAA